MKLITKKIEKELEKYPLYSQDNKGGDAICSAKFFYPGGAWTWYITEAYLKTGELFGVTINGSGDGEYGYLSLNELQNLKVNGLGVERDITFEPTALKNINDPYLKKFLEKF